MASEKASTQRYDAADAYIPLTERGASDRDILNILFEQAGPHLLVEVLRRENREKRITAILAILENLHVFYEEVLTHYGFQDLAAKVRRGKLLSVPQICREIEDRTKKEEIRVILSRRRDSLAPDLLEQFGFLPDSVFSREKLASREQAASAGSHIDVTAAPLKELFPPWFLANDGSIADPDDVVTHINAAEITRFPIFARLARWMHESDKEFNVDIRRAFAALKKLFKKSSPVIGGQPLEVVSDLGTESFATLIENSLDKRQPLRKRFESVRLLEWAIAIFSILHNPVYLAQLEAQRQIYDLLRIHVWDPSEGWNTMLLDPDFVLSVVKEEMPDTARGGVDIEQTRRCTSRKLNLVYQELLTSHSPSVIASKHDDRVTFDGREKEVESGARKVFAMQEIIRQCYACLRGVETELTKAQAKSRLRELRTRAVTRGISPRDFTLKPVGYELLGDHVAFSLGVDLAKRLRDFSEAERPGVNTFFAEFGNAIARDLGLKNVVHENFLWQSNGVNAATSEGFLLYKVSGNMEVEVVVHNHGGQQRERVLVPVEFQFGGMGTKLLKTLPGAPTSDEAYDARRSEDLGIRRLHPRSIASTPLYREDVPPELWSAAVAEETE